MPLKQQADQDFVWSEMLSYWEQTGQIGPGEASAWGYLADDQEWRDLGYQLSFGAPYAGDDPQHGTDAPWHAGLPSVWSDDLAAYWGDVTSGDDKSEAGLGAGWSGSFGWGAV